MCTSKAIKLLVLLGLVFSIPQSLASADTPPPDPPSKFYGTVKVDGENVPLNTPISARLAGGELKTVYTIIYMENSFYYDLIIEGSISENTGDEIDFFIDGAKADQTGIWVSGTNTEINLTAPGTTFSYLPIIFH